MLGLVFGSGPLESANDLYAFSSVSKRSTVIKVTDYLVNWLVSTGCKPLGASCDLGTSVERTPARRQCCT